MPTSKSPPPRRPLASQALGAATTAVSLLLPASGFAQTPGPNLQVDPLVLAQAAPSSEVEALQKFHLAGYNYCDAVVLASFWGESSVDDAKVKLGRVILDRAPEIEQQAVQRARTAALEKSDRGEWLCQWDLDGGYTPDDLLAFKAFWKLDDSIEVKRQVQRLMMGGHEEKLAYALEKGALARSGAPPAPRERLASGYVLQHSPEDAMQMFFDKQYNYCDAQVLAAFWGEDNPGDAKMRLGDKMLAFGPGDASAHLEPARTQALARPDSERLCWYGDAGFSYQDAERMAVYWGFEEVFDAKLKMTELLTAGRETDLRGALERATEASGG